MNIPKHACQPKGSVWEIENIDQWFCPDCGASGTDENVDFVEDRKFNDFDRMVTYCCGECFEEAIYITTNKE